MTSEAMLPKGGVFQEHTLPTKRARYYSQENNFDQQDLRYTFLLYLLKLFLVF